MKLRVRFYSRSAWVNFSGLVAQERWQPREWPNLKEAEKAAFSYGDKIGSWRIEMQSEFVTTYAYVKEWRRANA